MWSTRNFEYLQSKRTKPICYNSSYTIEAERMRFWEFQASGFYLWGQKSEAASAGGRVGSVVANDKGVATDCDGCWWVKWRLLFG